MPNTTYSLSSLERALGLLETLAEQPELTLTDVATAVGASKATAFRHLKVLEQGGYVTIDPATKRYVLGPRLLQLGHHAAEQLALPRIASEPMRELRDRFDETVHLGILMDGDVVHIGCVPSRQPLKMAAALGERAWPHVSSLGKCLLAWGPEETVAALLRRPLPQPTERAKVRPDEIAAELGRVRRRGYGVDDEESGVGLRCVGAPVHDAQGAVIAAISVSGPSERITRARVREIAPAAVAAADAVSHRLGWVPSQLA